MSQAPLTVVLCADDYAQSSAISHGILALIEAGRLSATSCMADAPHWPAHAAWLRPHAGRIDIGLHFNLTHGFDGQHTGIGPWIIRSLCGRLDRQALRQHLLNQLQAFEAAMGRAPDFIDGHQHVHLLPGIRQVLFDVLAEFTGPRPYLRLATPPLDGHDSPAKAAVLRALALGFARQARQRGLRLNAAFDGLYSLQPQADFAGMMQQWLNRAGPGSLIMCHPGEASADASDPIAATRPRELAHLGSDAFAAQLQSAGVRLGRLI